MAVLRGKGAMTAVNLLAKTFNNNVTKDGKNTRYFDVMVDYRDERGQSQTNLHLSTKATKDANGKTTYSNGQPYSAKQTAAIVEAAGHNYQPVHDKEGNEIGMIYGVKADVMPGARGGLVLNSNSLAASDFKVDQHTNDNQFAAMRAARDAQKAEQEAAKAAPEQTVEQAHESQSVVEQEAEQPAMG